MDKLSKDVNDPAGAESELNVGLGSYKKQGAYYDGIRAFIHHGSKGNDNPHELTTTEHSDWDEGWREAEFYGGYGFYDIHETVPNE